MNVVTSIALLAAAATGLLVLLVQLVSTRRHLAQAPPAPLVRPGISILKPLCGVDDELEANLEHFATLDYPDYEVLLGVRSTADAAWPIALDLANRYPGRVRALLQRGEPGLNPKVNQLITLAAHARHDIVLISDSNVRTRPGYLDEIAAHLADPWVGLVTHPIAGIGERRLGSRLDNLHLTCWTAPGTISAKRLAARDIVVGKSMALRRSDLRRIGGFTRVKDVLAEDYVLGLAIPRKLGKRVVVAHQPIENVSKDRDLASFVARYQRWAVMQRRMAGTFAYWAQLLLNPIALALAAVVLHPTSTIATAAAAIACAKVACDAAVASHLRPGGFSLPTLALVPLKDLLVGLAWLQGLLRSTVEWRGNRLLVLEGSRLAHTDGTPVAATPEAREEAA